MKIRWFLKSKTNSYPCKLIRFDSLHKRKGDKESHEGLGVVTETDEGERIELIFSPEEVDLLIAKAHLLKPRFADPEKLPPEFKED